MHRTDRALLMLRQKAKEVLGKMPDHITMRCSGNIIKNVKGVKVPNSGGMKGVEAAAVLGITGGDPSQALEVLEHVTDRGNRRGGETFKGRIL